MVDPEIVRSLIRAEPFRKFTLVFENGLRHDVKKRSAIGMSLNGKALVFDEPIDGKLAMDTSALKEVLVEPQLPPEAVERIEKIRELRNAAPFVPFAISIDDGREFTVERSYTIGIAPSGREICYGVSAVDIQRIPADRIREERRVAG
jgi:hypothetical protein